jgi:hypothetical protein
MGLSSIGRDVFFLHYGTAHEGLQSCRCPGSTPAESASRPRRRSRLADTEPDAPEKIYRGVLLVQFSAVCVFLSTLALFGVEVLL